MTEIGDPAVADCPANQFREGRVGREQPTPLGDAVGFAVEPLRPETVEIRNQRRLEQLGMDGRDSVDGVAPDDGEIRHAHLFGRGFFDQRDAAQAIPVSRVSRASALQEAAVDLKNDLQMPRQYMLQKRNRPLLQSLRHQGVIGVAPR